MKGLGVILLFALLAVYPSFSHANSCESLFSSIGQNAVVQKIKRKTSIPLEEHYAVLTPKLELSLSAKEFGLELIRSRSLFSTYHSDVKAKEKKLTRKEILELGDSLMENAKRFANEVGLNFTLRRLDLLETSKNILVISTKGNHPLNGEAKVLKDKNDVEIIYNPYELLTIDAEALFLNRQITVSESIIVNGSIFKDAVGKHELTHMRVKEFLRDEVPYMFHGETLLIKGNLPGKPGAYDRYLAFEEIDAFFTSIDAKLDSFINYKAESKQFGDAFAKSIWNGSNNSYLEGHLQNGYLVSVRTLGILGDSVKLMRKDASQVTMTRENGYIIAKWHSEYTSGTKFLTEIPILAPEKMTRAQAEKIMIEHLEQKIRAATYFKNLYKVGLDLFAKIEELPMAEKIIHLRKYKKIFKREYSFNSLENVPTQKELALSLE